jgi:glutathione S-transferase
MKLYYAPGACSLAPHIVAREAGMPLDLERVDLKSGKTETGDTFAEINPKGYVPAIALDNNEVLTEASAVLQYLADRAPQAELAFASGTLERYRLLEWLGFISTEIHKGFGPLWNPQSPEAAKTIAKATLGKRFAYLDQRLSGKAYLMGERFTIADAYLFTVTNWANLHAVDLSPYPNLKYMERVARARRCARLWWPKVSSRSLPEPAPSLTTDHREPRFGRSDAMPAGSGSLLWPFCTSRVSACPAATLAGAGNVKVKVRLKIICERPLVGKPPLALSASGITKGPGHGQL